jgi:branched-subunit amino acid aminotransferase/4-amino-4-deoxychorismate lyase
LGWRVSSERIPVEDLTRADALWLLSSVRIPCDAELHRRLWDALDAEL